MAGWQFCLIYECNMMVRNQNLGFENPMIVSIFSGPTNSK